MDSKNKKQTRRMEEESGEKTCSVCKEKKALSRFDLLRRPAKKSTSARYKSSCISCCIQSVKRSYYAKRDDKLEYQKQLNKRKRNQYRPIKNANAASHRAKLRKSLAAWNTKEDLKNCSEVYKERDRLRVKTGHEMHVDHTIPLNSLIVCGLHVFWNLEIVTSEVNLKKGNAINYIKLQQLYCNLIPTEITPDLISLIENFIDDDLKSRAKLKQFEKQVQILN